MSTTIRPESEPAKSRTRGKGLQLYRDVIGALNDEAAHADARRVTTRFFLLVNCYRLGGNRQSITTLRQRFEEELAQDPPKRSADLVLVKGRADRAEDQIREEAICEGMTPQERRLWIHRLKLEIGEAVELLRALEHEELLGNVRTA
jgi:hypothetical protein